MALACEKSFPFDSEIVNGEYDRTYLADDFAQYFRELIYSGVFMKESTNLQVLANGDMTLTMKAGGAIIDGYRYQNKNDITISIPTADAVLDRIDRVSITWDKDAREIHYEYIEGTPAVNPVPTEIRRDAEHKDYIVADIAVAAGAISIKQTEITDQRLNTEVCGLATPFAEFDSQTLYEKIEAYYAEMQLKTENWTQEEKDKFTTWFADIKNQLAGDVAANLQLQIGTLDVLKTNDKSSLVAAINEVNAKEVDVLDTREEIQANTTAGKVAGALPVKELYDSLGNISGPIGYPDMTQQIFSNTAAQAFTWTATQNCWVYGWCCTKGTNAGSAIKLNGENVILAHGVTNAEVQVGSIFPCKKGDVVSKVANGTTTGLIVAYAMR